MKIYSLGTSNRSKEEFLEILKKYEIEQVVDVRHFPTSRLFPHFKKENLKEFLKEKNIAYYHLEKLGGFRGEGYEEYMKTTQFQEGLEELIKILDNKKTVIICAEKFPWKCHRIFITSALENLGKKVLHIIERDKIWQPEKEPKIINPTCQKRFKKINNK